MQAILYFAIPEKYEQYVAFFYALDPIVFVTKLMITGKVKQFNIRCREAMFK
jgi:hypothetical protein